MTGNGLITFSNTELTEANTSSQPATKVNISSLEYVIAQETVLAAAGAAAAACAPEPAASAWLGRHACAGPPGATSGGASSLAAPGSGALGSLMTGTAWHAAAADPTCACTQVTSQLSQQCKQNICW